MMTKISPIPLSLILFLLHCPSPLPAQDKEDGTRANSEKAAPQGENQYRLDDATQLWRLTDNAAGLELDSTRNRGYALFNYEHWQGDHSRVQEGDLTNQLRFQTERYQQIGKYLHGYGRFNFDYGRLKNRAWCDVMRPYNATPFFAGSSIGGNYDFQDFDFTAALGSTGLGRWRFGLRLDYKVGDLSRLRDPRSRSQLLDYRLAPAITYTVGRNTWGLSGNYHRRKEKITGVTTVQQDATLMYYQMTGMEHATGTVGGYSSYWREWVDHRFGAELSFAHRHSGKQHLLISATIERGGENAYGEYKYEPGRFVDYRYGLNAHGRFRSAHILHELDAQAGYEEAYADEYRQEKQTELDAATGVSTQYYTMQLVYKKRYQVKQLNANVRYRLTHISGQAIDWYAGVRLSLNDTKNTALLPSSALHTGGYDFTLEGGLPLLKHRLWIDALAAYHLNRVADLSLANPDTDYARGVLLPDLNYYEANYWQARLSLTYQFPLTIKKNRTRWFLRAYGEYLRTNNTREASTAGLTIGLFN